MKRLVLLVFAAAILSAQTPTAPRGQRPPRPGVQAAGVQIPVTELKPEAVFEVPGAPDWMVVEDNVWISNRPKNSVARLDPKTNTVAATIEVGKSPCSGITAAFGSVDRKSTR